MSTAARKRLMRDFKRLQNDPPAGVSGSPLDNNVMVWQAVIFGPDETPWEGGTFRLLMEFTEDYPNKPPAVRFLSKIFHPNVYNDGKICLDILQNQWSPIYDIAAILTSIQSLLSDPNPASPANAEASQLYERDRREYNKRVRVVVEASWMDDEDAMAMDTKENSNNSMTDEPSRDMAAGGAGAGAGGEIAMGVAAHSSSSSAGDSVDYDVASAAGIAGVGEGMDTSSSSSSSSSGAMETDDGNAGVAPGSTVFTSTEATASAANG